MAGEQKLDLNAPDSESKQLPTPPPEPESPSRSESKTTQTDDPKDDKVGETTTESSEGKTSEGSSSKEEVKPDSPEKSKDEGSSEGKKDEKKDEKRDDEKKEEKKKLLPKGMKAEMKTLFAKTDAQCKCCTTWVEKNPDDESGSVEESDECKQHAVVVRKKKKHEGNRKPLKVDSIVVHSPPLKKVLRKLFAGYPDLVIDLDELIFDAPFAPFFHRWSQFEQVKNEEKDETTKSHLSILYEALAAELKPTIQRNKDLLRHKAIDFDILWTIFAPGSLMFSREDGHDRLYRVSDCEYWQDLSGMKFTVRCDMVDWDGEKFGRVLLSENMSKFKGSKKITQLPSFPLEFHPKAEEIKEKCIERGRKFWDLAGVHCKDYSGTATEYAKFTLQTVTNKRHIEGRIMLDEELFSKFNPDEVQNLRELNDEPEVFVEDAEEAEKEQKEKQNDETDKKEGKKEEVKVDLAEPPETQEKSETGSACETSLTKAPAETVNQTSPETMVQSNPNHVAETTTEEPKLEESDVGETEAPKPADVEVKPLTEENLEKLQVSNDEDDVEEIIAKEENKKQELDKEQLAICNSWLRGYSLTYQKWASFSVEHVRDVVWNESAFKELALQDDYRELILATIQSQIRQNQLKQEMEKGKEGAGDAIEFDDFIKGKGRGYIMLFSGNPGVGKTATAESIAELLKVPLCMISVGNLGTNAESVESALQDILEISAKWNAVLLLDEADIFLEQRTKHDLHRNAVVSVFLRLLEYYQGVLCLTTNRSEEIDEAFHSRIHISLPFPDLTETNREAIWRQFAKMTDKKAETYAQQQQKDKEGKTPVKPQENETEDGDKGPCSVNISNSEFRKLAQHPLNGRQIKNAFKTAVLLASYKKEKVNVKHVKSALKTINASRKEPLNMYN